MSGFALPRATVAASVRLADGDARRGRIYLSDRVPQHDGLESPLEMLNRAEGFFASTAPTCCTHGRWSE